MKQVKDELCKYLHVNLDWLVCPLQVQETIPIGKNIAKTLYQLCDETPCKTSLDHTLDPKVSVNSGLSGVSELWQLVLELASEAHDLLGISDTQHSSCMIAASPADRPDLL